jgi:hypothetical protein
MPTKKPSSARKPKAKSSPEPGQTIPVYDIQVGYPAAFNIPKENIPQQPNTYRDSQEKEFLFLNISTWFFEVNHDPLYAIEALTHAHRTGVYPPISVLRWLAEGFGQYLAQRGEVSLDQCLLKHSPGKPRNGFYQRGLNERNFKICFDIVNWKALKARESWTIHLDTIFRIVAKAHGVGWETVKKGYYSPAWASNRKFCEEIYGKNTTTCAATFVSAFPYAIFDELKSEVDDSIHSLHRDYTGR